MIFINEHFLFTKHPASERLVEEGIFLYVGMRLDPMLMSKGSAYDCAEADTCSGRRNNPRHYTLLNGRRTHMRDITDEEDFIYQTVYNHATPFVHMEIDLVTEWSIKGRGWTQPYIYPSDYSETDTDTDTDSDPDWGLY